MALKILVADDSATMRTIYQMTFAGEDAELTVVDGGRRLLEEARRMAPDVVLVDATLPDLDSYTVAESLSQEATLAHVPIIVLASQHHPYDAGRGSSAGVFDHLLKPFDTQALIDKVTAAAAEAHSAHAATPKPAPPQARPVSAPQGLGSPMAATGRGTQVMDRFRERQAPEAAPPAPPRAGQPAAGPASAPRSMSPAPHPPSASAAAPPAPRPAASESRLGAPASRPAAPSFNTPQEPFAA
ncbi:MAG: response regulator, partial [Polyangiales bacterium]